MRSQNGAFRRVPGIWARHDAALHGLPAAEERGIEPSYVDEAPGGGSWA